MATPGAAIPVKKMERALHAKGAVIHGVLSIGIERDDITNVHIGKVPIKPAFEINGEADFQHVSPNRAFMNGDIALKPNELDPFISALLRNGLTFQAEHQHMYDFSPIVWFIHYRGEGNPVKLASALYKSLKVTATPFPQIPPSHPHTSLDPKRLSRILHGYHFEVGNNGVVTVYVARRNAKMSWDIGCLYNQETDEHPQLYFSHELKVGNPYKLAAQVRNGLDRTNYY